MEDDDQVPEAAGWISRSAMATAAIEHNLFQRKEDEDELSPSHVSNEARCLLHTDFEFLNLFVFLFRN